MVEQIYDIVVEPGRLEHLCDVWVQHLQTAGEASNFDVLGKPNLLPHVERVADALKHLLDESVADSAPRTGAQAWVNAIRPAAIVVAQSGEITAANAAAQTYLGVRVGHSLCQLPLDTEALGVLGERLVRGNGNGANGNGNENTVPTMKKTELSDRPAFFRLQLKSQPAPALIRVIHGAGGDPSGAGIIMTIMSWPSELSGLLQNAFGLTAAEGEVLKDLALGYDVRDIAAKSKRSEPTVRTHVRAILAKTETNSQIELLRLTLGLMDGFQPKANLQNSTATGDPTGNGNFYHTIVVADGRRFDYLVIGDSSGAPFLMLPTDAGSTRLPASIELKMAQRGLRMIVPIRAGYGWSSPLPTGRHIHDVAIDDIRQLLDHLGIARAPILPICEDIRVAVEMACRHPDRISAVIATGAIMPTYKPQHFQRLPKFARFVIANGYYAPRTLPYIALAFYSFARRVGPKRFLQTVMAHSPGDLACLDDPEIAEALIKGSEISMRPGFTAHIPWAAGAIANFNGDWSQRLRDCPVPVILFHGHDDPYSPIETVREYAREIQGLTLHDYPGLGQLLYPVWPDIADAIERHIAR
jgi:pimeloyl-ACP methyl ester carboxylesterase/DNA-binding CsgD family transcriptional regulator